MIELRWIPIEDALSRLHPDNPKDHDIGAIIRSIEFFGFTDPPAFNEETGNCIHGHGRIKTVNQMWKQKYDCPNGLKLNGTGWVMPSLWITGFPDDADAEKAYLIADNKLTMIGGWHEPQLGTILQELEANRPDLFELTQFTGEDLALMLQDFHPVDMSEQPRLDELDPVICPHCGKNIREHTEAFS